VDEFPRPEAAHLGDHHGEQRVGGDVERHAEEDVGAPLVEVAREAPVGDVELEEHVARLERHPRQVGHVPGADDEPPRVRIASQRVEHVRELVDPPPVRPRPRAPLRAVHGTQIPVLVRPLVPDRHAVLAQVPHVRVAGQEPEQLVHHGAEVDLLGRDEREARGEIEAELAPEHAERARPRAVGLLVAALQDVSEQLEVRHHGSTLPRTAYQIHGSVPT
jgi:hypothetical protein